MSKGSETFWAVAGSMIVLFSAMLNPLITVTLAVALIVGAVIYHLVKSRKTGHPG